MQFIFMKGYFIPRLLKSYDSFVKQTESNLSHVSLKINSNVWFGINDTTDKTFSK